MKKYILIFASIGIFNIYSIKAQVNGAILQGNSVTASGQYSSAIGNSNMSLGASSFSMGFTTQAKGITSFAGGWESVAEGDASFAFGYSCTAKQAYNIVFGSASQAYMPYGIAIGNNAISGTTNKGMNAICIGNQAHAEADYSMALGQFVKSGGINSMVIGKGYSNTQFLVNNTANTIALGMNSTLPTMFITNSNGATVTGNVGIGTTNVGSKLQVNGNAAIGYSSSTAAPANGLLINGNLGIGTTAAATTEKLTVNGKVKTNALVLPDGEITSANALGIWVKNGNNIYNTNTGNLGVGIIQPEYKIHVSGRGQIDSNLIIKSSSNILNPADTINSSGLIVKSNNSLKIAATDFRNSNNRLMSRIISESQIELQNNVFSEYFKLSFYNRTLYGFICNLELGIDGRVTIGGGTNFNVEWPTLIVKNGLCVNSNNQTIFQVTGKLNDNITLIKGAKPISFINTGGVMVNSLQGTSINSTNLSSINIDAHHVFVNNDIIVGNTQASEWKDCVFKPDYDLKTINDVEKFIKENQHLPDVPSALEIEKNGINLGKMDAILLQKIEELTLYIIEQQKQIKNLEEKISGKQ